MVTREQANDFAREWIKAWNDRDLEAVLSHYTEDFELTSPLIAYSYGENSGVLRGKEAVRQYWAEQLVNYPDAKFKLKGVLAGVDSMALVYETILGKMAAEVFFLNAAGKIFRAVAHYNSF